MTKPGTRLDSRYQILKLIGEGGMGQVFMAEDLHKKGRKVAIKLLLSQWSSHTQIVERFRREADIIQRFNHPNIIKIYDYVQQGNAIYIVMEYAEGGSVKTLMEQNNKALAYDDIQKIIRSTADALDYAHQQGVIHRDVKPENILIAQHPFRILLADFGIAKDISAKTLTQIGQQPGSVYHMAPEQITADSPIGPQTDVYALGVVLYEMLINKRPFDGNTVSSVQYKQVHEPPPPLNGISPEINKVVMQALKKHPQQRFATAGAMATAFEQALVNTADSRPNVSHPPSAAPAPNSDIPQTPIPNQQAAVGGAKPAYQSHTEQKRGSGFYIMAGIALMALLLICGISAWLVTNSTEEPVARQTSSASPTRAIPTTVVTATALPPTDRPTPEPTETALLTTDTPEPTETALPTTDTPEPTEITTVEPDPFQAAPALQNPVTGAEIELEEQPLTLDWQFNDLADNQRFVINLQERNNRERYPKSGIWATQEQSYQLPIILDAGNYRWIVTLEESNRGRYQPIARSKSQRFTIIPPPEIASSPESTEDNDTQIDSTSSPLPDYAVPSLLAPENNGNFTGSGISRIEFVWESVGSLADNEYYVLVIEHIRGTDYSWTQNTRYVIGDGNKNHLAGLGETYFWQIVVAQTDETPDANKNQSPKNQERSPYSEKRKFIWTK